MGVTDTDRYQIFADLSDVSLSAWSGFSTHLSIYLTLLFAYCVVAYVAGAKLSRFQVISVSVMFFLAAELQAVIMFNLAESAREIAEFARGFLPQDVSLPEDSRLLRRSQANEPGSMIGGTLWQLGILVALLFMWNVRRSDKE